MVISCISLISIFNTAIGLSIVENVKRNHPFSVPIRSTERHIYLCPNSANMSPGLRSCAMFNSTPPSAQATGYHLYGVERVEKHYVLSIRFLLFHVKIRVIFRNVNASKELSQEDDKTLLRFKTIPPYEHQVARCHVFIELCVIHPHRAMDHLKLAFRHVNFYLTIERPSSSYTR